MCKQLPSRISPSPVIDALIEIRFEAMWAHSAVFGLIYNEIRDLYPGEVISLPILQIPEQIRNTDPNLRFKPLYRIDGDKTILQIGPDVLCISSKIPYIGWDEFFTFAVALIQKIINAKIIKRVLRLGHRYVNFFKGDILNDLTVRVSLGNDYSLENVLIRSEVKSGDFINILQLSNCAQYKQDPMTQEVLGTIIDIDTVREYSDNYFVEQVEKELKQAHICEKKLFFSLLTPSLLSNLNPEYHELHHQ